MSKRRLRHGVCKLTLAHGKLVNSHLLPKALTRAEGLAPGLMQIGQGRKERRSSSWYDSNLVSEEGEKILSDYDNWAIATLRKHKLVWTGWGPMQSLKAVASVHGTSWGIRKIEFENDEVPKRLRLFLLSILWRAAATDRREFAEVKLSSRNLEKLRLMVFNGNPEPLDFYPASLTQLSSLGIPHNMTPIAFTKQVPGLDGGYGWQEPIFRFFLDGLIVHYSRLSIKQNSEKHLGPLRVGGAN